MAAATFLKDKLQKLACFSPPKRLTRYLLGVSKKTRKPIKPRKPEKN